MAKRKILLMEREGGPWAGLLSEFFEDTESTLDICRDAGKAKSLFGKDQHDILFLDPALVPMNLIQAVKASRQAYPGMRVFGTGAAQAGSQMAFDGFFEFPPSLTEFQRQIMRKFDFPEKLDILVVDDEKDIGVMIKDFLESRSNPSFEVRYAENGVKGLNSLVKRKPDVLVLDIKMPEKDGREVYREAKQKGIHVPTIVFFDAISGDEMTEIRKHGRAAVIEKGAPQSAMPELMELIKKMYYFS